MVLYVGGENSTLPARWAFRTCASAGADAPALRLLLARVPARHVLLGLPLNHAVTQLGMM